VCYGNNLNGRLRIAVEDEIRKATQQKAVNPESVLWPDARISADHLDRAIERSGKIERRSRTTALAPLIRGLDFRIGGRMKLNWFQLAHPSAQSSVELHRTAAQIASLRQDAQFSTYFVTIRC